MNTADIRAHMEVVGSCGNHVGTVDRVLRQSIKLSRHDYLATGQHHYVPLAWVRAVDDRVRLDKPCDHVLEHWRAEFSHA